jgi:hypothetical protein
MTKIDVDVMVSPKKIMLPEAGDFVVFGNKSISPMIYFVAQTGNGTEVKLIGTDGNRWSDNGLASQILDLESKYGPMEIAQSANISVTI